MRRGRLSPFVTDLERRASNGEVSVSRAPRVFTPERNFFLYAIGMEFDVDSCMAEMKQNGGRVGPTAAQARAALVRAVRRAALQEPRVGADVLCSTLPRPGLGEGLVQFVAAQTWPVRIATPSTVVTAKHADHTPWIITRGSITAPSALVGDMIYDLGGYPLRVQGARGGGGLIGMQTSLRRPKPPTARR